MFLTWLYYASQKSLLQLISNIIENIFHSKVLSIVVGLDMDKS